MEKAANLLSRLNIACEGKAAMITLEWTGKCDKNDDTSEVVELDSDDEEDPLKILAQVGAMSHYRVFSLLRIPAVNLICTATAYRNWRSQEENYTRGA